MITKSIKHFLIAGSVCCGCAAALTSCSSMLETDSELVEYEKDNTLNHPTDTVYSVLGIINTMQRIADRTVLLGEMRGDLVTTTNEASADLKRLAAFDFSQENKYNKVSDYYAVINNCNYFLAHADTAMVRHEHKIFLTEYAAVKAFRAWTYLQLVLAYGSVPLVTQPVMTEQQAREAMLQPRQDIKTVCDYFIADLTPYAYTDEPNFSGGAYSFLPMRALLGDLCLWAERYTEAARWYNDFLNDKKKPIPMQQNIAKWQSASSFNVRPYTGYSSAFLGGTNDEALSFIAMELIVFNGTVSELPNIFNSTSENNYFFQATPSKAMFQLSASQDYCIENKSVTPADTIYVPKVGLLNDNCRGDLRLFANYTLTSLGQQDPYSENSSQRQNIYKYLTKNVTTYRSTMVYLRYAEALNRAGYPQSAMCILKYGLCPDNVKLYVDTVEQKKAGGLIDFDFNVFTSATALGVHSRGSGDSFANKRYVLPQPDTQLATRQDTVDYQIPLVEDMIIDEMALEGAFEGNRYYDLMRVALRRGDNAYLADPISKRNGEVDAALRSKLMDKANWYLPLP